MSKIVQLTAENVKRLHAVQITPTGNLVVVGGNNAQGKSSVLDAIAMALGGSDEIPSMPVRRGEKRASVVLDLGDIVVKRTFTAQEGGTATSALVVESKDKMRASAPQTLLEKLTGKVTFDPLAFVSMDADKQAATLKRLVGLDLSALDQQRAKIFAERATLNADIKRAAFQVDALPSFPDAPAESVDTSALMQELDAARTYNAKLAALDTAATTTTRAVRDQEGKTDALKLEIANLETQLSKLRDILAVSEGTTLPKLRESAQAAAQAVADFKTIDEAPIRTKLAESAKINANVQANVIKADAAKALADKRATADALTSQLAEIDRQKDEQLAAVKFPVAGLSFTADGNVAFNGVPFDQASAAERMRCSVAIAAAMNPKLRVMLVRDASLLDEDGLAQLAKLAEEFDLQVWAERVGKGAECSVIIEDGSVATIEEATAKASHAAEQAQADLFSGAPLVEQKGAA
jgi:DNA repair exonuclease SbcCD ATPase subunit